MDEERVNPFAVPLSATISTIDDDLITATSRNITKEIVSLLSQGANPNSRDSDGNTPLICAARNKNEQVIDYLLNNGASLSINWTNHEKRTALMVAANKAHFPSVQCLIRANALVDFQDERGTTALMMAAKSQETSVVECILLTGQCSVNIQNKSGKTALHNAAKMGCLGNVALLTFQGADVDCRDRWMNTPLMYATLHEQSNVVAFLIQAECDVNAMNKGGRMALHTAAQLGHNKILDLLLAAGAWPDVEDVNGNSPLLLAGRYHHHTIVSKLLPLGCNVFRYDQHGQGIIHYAASGGLFNEVKLLLAMGVHPDMNDKTNGNTPLVYAVRRNQIAIVQLLLEHNCDIDIQGCTGGDKSSVLVTALRNGHVELARLLVNAGCDTNILQNDSVLQHISPLFTEDSDLQTWVNSISHNPRTLKQLSRFCIRKQLTFNIVDELRCLPLPKRLKQDILLQSVVY